MPTKTFEHPLEQWMVRWFSWDYRNEKYLQYDRWFKTEEGAKHFYEGLAISVTRPVVAIYKDTIDLIELMYMKEYEDGEDDFISE